MAGTGPLGVRAAQPQGHPERRALHHRELRGDDSEFSGAAGAQLHYEEVRDWCRLSHAQTFASCQGTEFTESLTLWETDHPKFTWRHLFVGLSRGRDAKKVHLSF